MDGGSSAPQAQIQTLQAALAQGAEPSQPHGTGAPVVWVGEPRVLMLGLKVEQKSSYHATIWILKQSEKHLLNQSSFLLPFPLEV